MSKGPWGGKGSIKFKRVLREFTMGKLRSSAGSKVRSERNGRLALAIAFSEARNKGWRNGRFGKTYSPYRPRKTKK